MTEQFTYDAQGNILTATDFRGQTTTLAYDVNHQLGQQTLPDGSQVRMTYTPTGQRATVTDARGLTTYHYDRRDRLLAVTHPDGTTVASTYDAAGNRLTVATPAGSTSFTSDAAHRLQPQRREDARASPCGP